MGLITRLYTFTSGTSIVSAQMNAELNQILTLVNGNLETSNMKSGTALANITAEHDTDGTHKDVNATSLNITAGNKIKLRTDVGMYSSESKGFVIDDNSEGNLVALLVRAAAFKLTGKLEGQPVAFSVHKNGTGQVVPASTWTKVTWSTEDWDTNGNFASSRFTPLVVGKYDIKATLSTTDEGADSGLIISIYKNGVEHKTVQIERTISFYGSISICADVNMNGSTDYLEIYVYTGIAGGCTIDGDSKDSFFQGHLIALSST